MQRAQHTQIVLMRTVRIVPGQRRRLFTSTYSELGNSELITPILAPNSYDDHTLSGTDIARSAVNTLLKVHITIAYVDTHIAKVGYLPPQR